MAQFLDNTKIYRSLLREMVSDDITSNFTPLRIPINRCASGVKHFYKNNSDHMNKIFAFTGLFLLFSCSANKVLEDFKTNGIVIDREHVIAYFPNDVIPAKQMNEITDTLNLGIMLANEFIGGPLDWQINKERQLIYYFMPGNFVSHASDYGEIYIPVWRAKYGQSPWLHETMHFLLQSEKGFWRPYTIIALFKWPRWLDEGMAEYLAMKISFDNQLPKADLFKSGGYPTVDSICSLNLKGENGPYILKHIGEPGVMIKGHGKNRNKYAPTFYNCSCSFTKYLVETYGLDIMLTAISEYKNELKTIEELTGKSIKELKEEWLLIIE
jgi:hypothetical protein